MPEWDPRTYGIIGAAMQVHRSLGPGLSEGTYQEALAMEFEAQGIPHRREAPTPVIYRGKPLKSPRIADFICYDSVVTELKAAEDLAPEHLAQAIHYMRASGLETGLLLNFGRASLQFRRLVCSRNRSA